MNVGDIYTKTINYYAKTIIETVIITNITQQPFSDDDQSDIIHYTVFNNFNLKVFWSVDKFKENYEFNQKITDEYLIKNIIE